MKSKILLLMAILPVCLTNALAVRYAPTWSVYYDKGDGEGYNKKIDDQAFSIPGTDCVVQEPNHGEGSDGHFIRKVKCRSGEEHVVDCTASLQNQVKKCHVVAEKFSLNLSVKVYPHLGNSTKDESVIVTEGPAPILNGDDKRYEYLPKWSVSSNGSNWDVTSRGYFEVEGTGCTVGLPNQTGGEDPEFTRGIKCGDKVHVLKCNGAGRSETHCKLEINNISLFAYITRYRKPEVRMKEEAEFEKTRKGTY